MRRAASAYLRGARFFFREIMATPFTTWAALYAALLDIYNDYLTSGNITTESLSYSSGASSRDIKFRTIGELERAMANAKAEAEKEANPTVAYGRTFGKNGGGRWL